MKDIPQIKKSVKMLSHVLDFCGQSYSLLFPARPGHIPDRHILKLISFDQIHRILVIQLYALGDVLLSLPLLKGLRALYPQGEIDFWVARNLQQEFKVLLPYINRTVAADFHSIARIFSMVRELRKRHYDMAFVLYPVAIGGWLAWVTGARYRIGYTQDLENTDSLRGAESFLLTHPVKLGDAIIHDTQRYLDLARSTGLSLRWDPPFLYPPSSMNSFTNQFLHQDQLLYQSRHESLHQSLHHQCSHEDMALNPSLKMPLDRPLIGMNPNASWEGKKWPGSKFARLADLLIQEQKVQVLFFGSKTEREYVEGIISLMRNKPLSAAGQTSLTQMASLIRRCLLFISNDTGPMHMACALDVPTLAIMGPTKIEMFRPWASQSRVVQNPLPCTPCQQENTDLCHHFSCIRSICVDSVYETAVDMMRSLS
jgi:ADP-heptose:LPS heptosyltransferase